MKNILWLILLAIFISGPVRVASAAGAVPTVTATIPANNATDVPTATAIQITFSIAMLPGPGNNGVQNTSYYSITRTSGTGAIPNITGVTVDDINNIRTVTLSLSGSFGSLTTYNVTVSSNVRSSSGNKMVSSYSFSFTTRDEIAPTVCASLPAPSGMSTKNTSEPIKVIFSELMTQGSFDTGSTFTVNDGTSNIAGSFSFSTNATSYTGTCPNTATKQVVQFTPAAALQNGKTYTVTVTGVTDKASTPNPMQGSASWLFTVDTAAPSVISPPIPDVGAYTAAKRPPISVTFTDDMTAASVTTSSFYLKKGGTSVGTTSPSQSGRTFTITPSADLSSNTQYSVTVKGGISTCTTCVKDAATNPMSSDYVWSFYVDYSPPLGHKPLPGKRGHQCTNSYAHYREN